MATHTVLVHSGTYTRSVMHNEKNVKEGYPFIQGVNDPASSYDRTVSNWSAFSSVCRAQISNDGICNTVSRLASSDTVLSTF